MDGQQIILSICHRSLFFYLMVLNILHMCGSSKKVGGRSKNMSWHSKNVGIHSKSLGRPGRWWSWDVGCVCDQTWQMWVFALLWGFPEQLQSSCLRYKVDWQKCKEFSIQVQGQELKVAEAVQPGEVRKNTVS